MFRFLRVPERLFTIAAWTVSLVFGGFLIGLGGRIVGQLPGVRQNLDIGVHIDSTTLAALRAARDSLVEAERNEQDARERALQQHEVTRNAYMTEREGFDAWVATRRATTDPLQDVEVLRRTLRLDTLRARERAAQLVIERHDEALLTFTQAREANGRALAALEAEAAQRMERGRFWEELRIFGIRLALTLPLLIVAGLLVVHKRHSEYWPLIRGFVLFAVFAFFVELVPYLPSYGGYVRYTVGVVASAVAGVYIIRSMRLYLARRRHVEQQSEAERRRTLSRDEALKRMDAGVCPGCERRMVTLAGTRVDFCVHCGLRLYDECQTCETRKNSFFPHCPVCGAAQREAA